VWALKISNRNVSLCVGLTAEIGNIQYKSVHILFFSVGLLQNYEEGLGNLQNTSVPTPFVLIHTDMYDLYLFKENEILK